VRKFQVVLAAGLLFLAGCSSQVTAWSVRDAGRPIGSPLSISEPIRASIPKKILTCCDSITVPSSYHRHLAVKFQAVEIIPDYTNVAIGGTGCDYWVPRMPALLAEHDPEVVLLNCGTNDGVFNADHAAAFHGYYTTLISDIRASGAKVIASRLQLSDRWNPATPSWLYDNEVRVNAIIEEVTADLYEQNIIGVANMTAIDGNAINNPDGVHPGPIGDDLYAQAWFGEGRRLGWW
jgi:hypothetical protein